MYEHIQAAILSSCLCMRSMHAWWCVISLSSWLIWDCVLLTMLAASRKIRPKLPAASKKITFSWSLLISFSPHQCHIPTNDARKNESSNHHEKRNKIFFYHTSIPSSWSTLSCIISTWSLRSSSCSLRRSYCTVLYIIPTMELITTLAAIASPRISLLFCTYILPSAHSLGCTTSARKRSMSCCCLTETFCKSRISAWFLAQRWQRLLVSANKKINARQKIMPITTYVLWVLFFIECQSLQARG